MREIKFRAWINDSGLKKMREQFIRSVSRMLDVDRIDFHRNLVGFERVNGLFWFGCDTAELMQFTGLHDKNGKEIWEGDIMANSGGHPFEVKWGKEEWNEDGFGTGFQFDLTGNQYEVLGNIYETPDLLKKE